MPQKKKSRKMAPPCRPPIRTRVADTGVRVGVECGAIGKVSSHRGRVMVPADLRRYHRLLLKKQRGVSSAPGKTQSRVPAAGGLEGDLIDQANADEEAELQIRLHQTDGRLLRAIEEALARMRQGTYGVCVVCKQPISKARLEAVPWTHVCREGKGATGRLTGPTCDRDSLEW